MSGHVVARKRRWPWAILSLLFTVALVWSFAVTADGRIILQVGMAAGLVLSLLRLTLTSRSSRRVRRAQEADEGTETEADDSRPATDGHGPTYEEVFGTKVEFDAEGIPLAPEEEEWSGEEAEVEAEVQRSAEQPSAEQPPTEPTPTSEDDPQPVPSDLEETVDQVEPGGDGGEFQEHLRRMREEFRARAEEAALRVKQREAELHEASVADQER